MYGIALGEGEDSFEPVVLTAGTSGIADQTRDAEVP